MQKFRNIVYFIICIPSINYFVIIINNHIQQFVKKKKNHNNVLKKNWEADYGSISILFKTNYYCTLTLLRRFLSGEKNSIILVV